MHSQYSLSLFLILAIICCASCQEIWCYAITKTKLRNYFIDAPNSRSSHSIPTPRSGGALFSFFTTSSFIYLSFSSILPYSLTSIICIGTIIISFIGLFDDLNGLSSRLRLFSQLVIVIAIAITIALTAPLNSINHILFILTTISWCLFTLSLINFYNFADGINGHITLQFIVSIVSYLLFVEKGKLGVGNNLSLYLIIIAPIFSSLIIFLKYNFIQKTLFMGDTGSTFLGAFIPILFFIIPLYFQTPNQDTLINFYSPIETIAIWIFFTQIVFIDCAAMVVAKVILKIPFSYAHKLHFYQRLSRKRGYGHQKTAITLALLQCVLNSLYIFLSKYINKNELNRALIVYLILIALIISIEHIKSLKNIDPSN